MANTSDFQSMVAKAPATIASGATESGTVEVGGAALVGLVVPAMTGTTITFKVAAVATDTPVVLYDRNGSIVSHTVSGTARNISVDPTNFAGWPFVRVVSGSAEAAERSIGLICRPV